MKIIKHLKGFDGLENGFGLKLVYNQRYNRIIICDMDGNNKIFSTRDDALDVAKLVGFKFKYEPVSFVKGFIGKNINESIIELEEVGYECEIVAKDNEYFIVTSDLRSDRVRIKIINDIITDIYIS